MENLITPDIQGDENVLSFINKIDYGSNYFISNDNETLIFIKDCCKIINASLDNQVVRIEEEKAIDELEFRGFKFGEGLHKIVCSVKKDDLLNLSDDSYMMFKYIKEAFNSESMVKLYLDDSLHSYAKKQAKKDLIFGLDNEIPFFIKAKKKLNVYEQIKQSFYNGEDYIKFDFKTTSVATVRCYASTISNMAGVKFRCSIVDGFITVYFKPISIEQDAENKIIPILKNAFKTNEKIKNFLDGLIANFQPNSNPIIEAGFEYNGKVYDHSEWAKQPIWIRQGYESEYNMENDIKGPDATPKIESFDDDPEF